MFHWRCHAWCLPLSLKPVALKAAAWSAGGKLSGEPSTVVQVNARRALAIRRLDFIGHLPFWMGAAKCSLTGIKMRRADHRGRDNRSHLQPLVPDRSRFHRRWPDIRRSQQYLRHGNDSGKDALEQVIQHSRLLGRRMHGRRWMLSVMTSNHRAGHVPFSSLSWIDFNTPKWNLCSDGKDCPDPYKNP